MEAQNGNTGNGAVIEEFEACYQKWAGKYDELIKGAHLFNSFGILTHYAVVTGHTENTDTVSIEAKKTFSGNTLTDDAVIFTQEKELTGAPLLGHALQSRNILSIQAGIGLMGGFALTIVKENDSLAVTYYEYADGEKVFKTSLLQQWKESLTMPMQVHEAATAERDEDGRKVIYIKIRVSTQPYYYKLSGTSDNDDTSRQLDIECLLRCYPERMTSR